MEAVGKFHIQTQWGEKELKSIERKMRGGDGGMKRGKMDRNGDFKKEREREIRGKYETQK